MGSGLGPPKRDEKKEPPEQWLPVDGKPHLLRSTKPPHLLKTRDPPPRKPST